MDPSRVECRFAEVRIISQLYHFSSPYRFYRRIHFIGIRPLLVYILPFYHFSATNAFTIFAILGPLPVLPFFRYRCLAHLTHLQFYHFNLIGAANGFTVLSFLPL